MKAFYLFIAIAVVVASVVATEEENLYDLLDKKSLSDEDLEQLVYGNEPMVKRGRFKFCSNQYGDQCICDRRFRNSSRRRYVNCVPKDKGQLL